MSEQMSDKERYDKINRLLSELKAQLETYLLLIESEKEITGNTSLDFPRDYSFECSMCGKPMEYRFCGMCTHCEQVWNG